MAQSEVVGIKEARDMLQAAAKKAGRLTDSGLLRVGFDVIADATVNLRPSIVTGNLQNSAYVRNVKVSARPNGMPKDGTTIPSSNVAPLTVEFGYTAKYAHWVHDHMAGRAPQFLANAVKAYLPKVEGVLKDAVRREGMNVE